MLKSAAKYREFEKQQLQSLIKEKMIELDRYVQIFLWNSLTYLFKTDFELNMNHYKKLNVNKMKKWNNFH
jgi:hypothetical protein